jgi:hypothetical protein
LAVGGRGLPVERRHSDAKLRVPTPVCPCPLLIIR